MRKCIIIINIYKKEAKLLACEIEQYLLSKGIEYKEIFFSGGNNDFNIAQTDFVLTLGGDGTVLYAARKCALYGIPVVPVNLGEFGFIAGISKSEWKSSIEKFLNDDIAIAKRTLTFVEVERNGEKVFSSVAMNDVVIKTTAPAKIAELNISCNGHPFGRFRSDGVIISTPTGSTAYSAAAGGPIVDPDLDVLVLNPICAFSLSNRPLVLNSNQMLDIEILPSREAEIVLTCDGQVFFNLLVKDRLFINIASNKALLVGCDSAGFYKALRSKLNWSGGSNA